MYKNGRIRFRISLYIDTHPNLCEYMNFYRRCRGVYAAIFYYKFRYRNRKKFLDSELRTVCACRAITGRENGQQYAVPFWSKHNTLLNSNFRTAKPRSALSMARGYGGMHRRTKLNRYYPKSCATRATTSLHILHSVHDP